MPEVQVLLPVYNEAQSIEATLREIDATLRSQVTYEFLVCEDGSRDGTREVVQLLAGELPIQLLPGGERKGYSRAVIDGMRAMTAPYLLCLDSDGQCEPGDFAALWRARTEADVVIGWRVHRSDTFTRRLFSRTFYRLYRILFPKLKVHDPSCPFLLIPRHVVQTVLPKLGAMSQGFWWEFVARCYGAGFSFAELPVRHRLRTAGQTQVYRAAKIPGIAYSHVLALFRIWRETHSHV